MKGERPNSLALALKGFFSDYLPRVRGTSPHTILSYRDAIKLLLVHLSRKKGIPVANLTIEEIGVTEIVAFLDSIDAIDFAEGNDLLEVMAGVETAFLQFTVIILILIA